MSSDHSKRLIVGVDGSHLSNAAVRWAARSAQLRGLDLHLVHALAGDMPLLGFGARDDLDPIRRQAQATLEAAKAQAHAVDPDLTVTTSCQKGFASKALVRASTGAAGIVLGTNGHGTLSRASVGAVAQQVATYAKCPVAVIPRESPAHAEHGVVVVGVDTSTTARRALQRAFDHAVVRGCALQVVHAWNPRGADNPARGQSDSWDAYAKEFEAIVDQTLESSRREQPRTDVAVEVVKGDPRRVLADRSADADLVVLGARGDGGFPGMHIGRVALHLMGHSASPVILVR